MAVVLGCMDERGRGKSLVLKQKAAVAGNWIQLWIQFGSWQRQRLWPGGNATWAVLLSRSRSLPKRLHDCVSVWVCDEGAKRICTKFLSSLSSSLASSRLDSPAATTSFQLLFCFFRPICLLRRGVSPSCALYWSEIELVRRRKRKRLLSRKLPEIRRT